MKDLVNDILETAETAQDFREALGSKISSMETYYKLKLEAFNSVNMELEDTKEFIEIYALVKLLDCFWEELIKLDNKRCLEVYQVLRLSEGLIPVKTYKKLLEKLEY